MKCKFCKRNATFVNETQGGKTAVKVSKGRTQQEVGWNFKFLKSKTLPRMHHNMRVSTVKFIRYLLNSFGVITTQLGSI